MAAWLMFFLAFQSTLAYMFNDFKDVKNLLSFLLIVSLPTTFLAGIIIESLDYFLLDYRVLRNAYVFKIVVKSVLHVVIFLLIIYKIAFLFVGHAEKIGIKTITAFTYITTEKGFIILLFYSYLISFLINFLRQIDHYFGHNTLMHLFLGKYRKPKEDNRIFLFLDLNNSTTLAERMGHYNYSSLIQDCFKDLTQLILKYQAEVYQYVGDQVVLHWKNSPLNKSHLIDLFFDFETKLADKKEYYLKKYNEQPSFKAGVDLGLVMVSEVGEIKKMIAYHGDVLNVAARVEGLCNSVGKKFLVSEHFFDEDFTTASNITVNYVDSKLLKGKRKKLNIYSINR